MTILKTDRRQINLLYDTLRILEENGKTPADVRFVANGEECGTWEQFSYQADRCYPDCWHGPFVANWLIIVGDNWWLERGECSGSEWWEFKTLPQKPAEGGPLKVWAREPD